MLVFLLRIAKWHVGKRNTESPVDTFWRYAFTERTLTTFVLYVLSAFFYSEVYVWTRTGTSGLEFTDPGKLHERIRLNERPIYLRFLFFALAVAQSVLHLWRDYDQVPVAVRKAGKPQEDPMRFIWTKLPKMASTAGITMTVAWGIGSFVYYVLGVRQSFWGMWYFIMKHFIGLGKTPKPPGVVPYAPLAVQFIVQGTILALLWQFCNKIFDIYMAQEPLKNQSPITADSKDPNGSLLVGLKSKKEDNKV